MDLAEEYDPGTHPEQLVDPPDEKKPAGQVPQLEDPALDWYVPIAHSEHALAREAIEYMPIAQLVHAHAPPLVYVPAAQVEQLVEPVIEA
jgi:hypothetical protein